MTNWQRPGSIKVERRTVPDDPEWSQIRVTCWHRNRAVLAGPSRLVDLWADAALSNPCKWIKCPQRVRVHQGGGTT